MSRTTRSAAASSSTQKDDSNMEMMSPEGSSSSPSAPNTPANPFSTDRKKATHLRCERQRREAINSGYNELKDLIPQTTTSLGCKTTNAAILFSRFESIIVLSRLSEKVDLKSTQVDFKST
ncbi:hypothetical protein B9Z55_008683 [Caenorhabditis nigoni]|uniref:BHLH domain-containing protein n=1 Tax=Caenorhabditis nigoni TaxID=1611254 RepID=A0A2G5UNZ8_9PELO|nr:hypothetical protein B9Z55_008683 [Caenorhabditis nigoni]